MAVYQDHAAGTPMRPAAVAALAEAAARAGNPSSVHRHGQAARAALEEARERLAAVLDCDPLEVVLTSGGTESVNLAITGAYRAARGRTDLLVPGGEHAATVETVDALVAAEGGRLVPLPVDRDARLEPEVLGAALAEHRGSTALVTVLQANNEVGTVNRVDRFAELTREAGVPLHVDAVAAFGAVPVSFRTQGADLLSVSAHKVGGPAGIGALVVGRRTALAPVL
ncbi:MAG: aminotransferase class V-fold PLP-dependent enzyme, partial [Amnibacterium sp.]